MHGSDDRPDEITCTKCGLNESEASALSEAKRAEAHGYRTSKGANYFRTQAERATLGLDLVDADVTRTGVEGLPNARPFASGGRRGPQEGRAAAAAAPPPGLACPPGQVAHHHAHYQFHHDEPPVPLPPMVHPRP
ncbi:hypothetical protein JCM11491_001987 [Sporobolomyces phaffii]